MMERAGKTLFLIPGGALECFMQTVLGETALLLEPLLFGVLVKAAGLNLRATFPPLHSSEIWTKIAKE